jgi:UDP-perosamine 4-acetyltransferase
VVILGSGGHAKVVIEILELMGEYSVYGCTGAHPGPERVLDYPVLGTDSALPSIFQQGIQHAFVAIGDNALRLKLSDSARDLGFGLVRAVSPHAIISPRSRLAEGVAIMSGAVVNSDSRIGRGAIINTGSTVDHDCEIGDFSHIAPGVHLAGNVSIGMGAFVGVGASIIPGVSVGKWAVIGAGAVVIRNVPAGATVMGVPAVPRSRKRD